MVVACTDLLKLMKPDNFEDISAVSTLLRPEPDGCELTCYALRKNGRQEITPSTELEEPLKDILGTTFGLIVYQEQVMQIAQRSWPVTRWARQTFCVRPWVRRRRRSWTSGSRASARA